MKKPFYLTFQFRVSLMLFLLVSMAFLVMIQLEIRLVEETLSHEKENKLLSITRILDAMLDEGGYEGILQAADGENAGRDEKIKILHNALRDITEKVAAGSEGLGVGYYCKELDSILTYGPENINGHLVGQSIDENHKAHRVMDEGQYMLGRGEMVRGNIMNAMLPLIRNGKVIGYVWANELEESVSSQVEAIMDDAQIILAVTFVLMVVVLLIFSRRTARDVDTIIEEVHKVGNDLSYRIPSLKGDLGDVVTSINDMAQSVFLATRKTEWARDVLQSVMSNMEAAITVCDPNSSRLVYANPYVQKLCNVESLEDKVCYEVLYGLSEPCKGCPQAAFFYDDGSPNHAVLYHEEHNVVLERDFLVADRLIMWHDGRYVHLRVATDVTDRKALVAAQTANQAQRDFLARMSHEIRTPMNGVLGMTRLALQENPPPKQKNYLNKIQSSASLLLGIINDILDFSRIEAGAMTIEHKSFSIHEVIERVRELILPRAAENETQLKVLLDTSVPEYAVGDSLRLSQVLLNLLGNATKFTKKGTVTLKVSASTPDEHTVRMDCSVTDSGIGMTLVQQQELFKPFSQADTSTSRKFGGTGLGLSICKALVELMDGEIGVASKEGEGSTFFFHVFLAPDMRASEVHLAADAPWLSARYDNYEFLLVEDNVVNQEIALAILEDFGVRVDVASNGKEAVSMFEQKDYALILMDVRMPIMDGMEATRCIRAHHKHDAQTVPIVAMTANAMEEDKEESRAVGMNGHIAKPIDMDELKQVFYRTLYADTNLANRVEDAWNVKKGE